MNKNSEQTLRKMHNWVMTYISDPDRDSNLSLEIIEGELYTAEKFSLTISMIEDLDKGYQEGLVMLFKYLNNLKELEIWGIQEQEMIDNIPLEFLGSLEKLTFESCKFEKLPDDLYSLRTLKELSIRYALEADGISEKISQLKELTSIQIVSDGLRSLPRGIGVLKKLKYLRIITSNLQSIPEEIGLLNGLTFLEIQANALFPQSVSKLNNLDGLFIEYLNVDNPLSDDDFYKHLAGTVLPLRQLKYLHIKSLALKKMPQWIAKFKHLETLSIAALIDEPKFPEVLRDFTNLKNLSFTENYITEIPAWISELKNLEFLDFTSTNITGLPDSIADLPNLVQLNIMILLYIEEDTIEKIRKMLPNCEVIG